jgi:hypothetical protein
MDQPSVYSCDRCSRVFDTNKIIQGVYGTIHCSKCMKELHNHSIRERVARWNQETTEAEPVRISELLLV